jgi:hypothetical protein
MKGKVPYEICCNNNATTLILVIDYLHPYPLSLFYGSAKKSMIGYRYTISDCNVMVILRFDVRVRETSSG